MPDEEKEALNEESGGDTANPESPTEGEETSQEPESEAKEESQDKPEAEEKADAGKSSSRSAQSRIRELAAKRKEAEAGRDSLAQRLESLTQQGRQGLVDNQSGGYPQQDDLRVEPGQELSLEEYNERLRRAEQRGVAQADALINMRLAQRDTLDRIDKEARESMEEYPELNPKGETYDEELSQVITETVAEAIRSNPSSSVKKIVSRLMKPYKNLASRTETETAQKVASQKDQAALRPEAGKPDKGDKKDLSWQEIEQQVGVVRDY